MATYRTQQWLVFGKIWYIFDAKWQNPFHAAKKICDVLHGRHKPIYHNTSLVGDHVIAINTRHVAMPGEEWRRRVYFHHTGYPRGASWTLAYELHEKDPTLVFYKAVYREFGRSLKRPNAMQRLHCFPDAEVPEEFLQNVSGQIRQLRSIDKKISDYSEEEITKFPKIIDWPKDYVINTGSVLQDQS
uniref:39S ribosomal protein L13, mitochondrial n=1 Tax=Strigamia maritima TaxID=126957 RepID=T1JJD7_STRMM